MKYSQNKVQKICAETKMRLDQKSMLNFLVKAKMIDDFLHKLQVFQIEFKRQNEALRLAQITLKKPRICKVTSSLFVSYFIYSVASCRMPRFVHDLILVTFTAHFLPPFASELVIHS